MPTLHNLIPLPEATVGTLYGFPALARRRAIEFDVYEDVIVAYSRSGSDEQRIVFDGENFIDSFAGSRRSAIDTGWHFRVVPRAGWVNTAISLHTYAYVPEGPMSADQIEAALAARGVVNLSARDVVLLDRELNLPDGCVINANYAELRCTSTDKAGIVARNIERFTINNARITRPGFATSGGDGVVIQNVRHAQLNACLITDHFNEIAVLDCVSPVPHVINAGMPGATAYAYVVVAVVDGLRMEIERAGVTRTGHATLDGSNHNTVQWADLNVRVTSTHTYEIYRTIGGASQGLIGTADAGVRTLNDTGLPGTTACPDAPIRSPMINSITQGTSGATSRKYAVVAVVDGVRQTIYDTVTELLGHATLDATNYTLLAWQRVITAQVSERYEVYRVTGGGSTGTSTGLIGTCTSVDRLRDVGQVATGSLPAAPAATCNERLSIRDTYCAHSNALGTNNQYGLQLNSIRYLDISSSAFDGHWLDGIKARARVYSLRWTGGHANDNGKGLNDGASGDGADFFAGVFSLDIDGVNFVRNGGNGTTSKTIGWWQAGQAGNPEMGNATTTSYRRVCAQYNLGSGIQLEGVEDDQLMAGEGVVRGRVAFPKISDSFLDYNLSSIYCNARGLTCANTTMRGNKNAGLTVQKQASDAWFIRCDIYGNGTQAGSTITCVAKASMADTDFVTVFASAGQSKIYEFDTTGNGVTGGRVQVNISAATTANDVATILAAAINASGSGIRAGVDNGTVQLTHGVLTVMAHVANAGFTVSTTTYPDVTVEGEIIIKTLGSDLAAGATSFTIPDATGVPTSGRVSFGRKVAGVAPSPFLEVYDYKRAGTTVTLFTEYPGSSVVSAATVFNHNTADGANARDVGFSSGARKIHFDKCNFVGAEYTEATQWSLDGDLNGTQVMTRNHVEIYEGSDEIEILDCATRYVSSDAFGAPYVPVQTADLCFTARVYMRHADHFHATPTSRYYGGIGSEYTALKQAATGGTAAISGVKYRKESGLADTRTGWIPLFEQVAVQTLSSSGGTILTNTKTTLLANASGADTHTMPAGPWEGWEHRLICTVAGANITVNGTFINDATAYTSITFTAVGQAVHTEYHASGGHRITLLVPDTATHATYPTLTP